VEGFESYTPAYPTIRWQDGIPRVANVTVEIMSLRTGSKPTIDVRSAIKYMDEVDDEKADEIIARIEEDEEAANGTVDSSIFNDEGGEE
ncbi:portal protein, partial [Brevibacillus laterosporus]|nr:portal protein [Brevibacillus laterosporus]